jgi:hypothetical protein
MGTYEDTVRILEVELGQVEQGFRGLGEAEWATPTKLRPLDESQPPWTLFELAGHFDISIGLTVMLMAEPQAGQVGRDRVSFFIFPAPRSPRSSTTTPTPWSRGRPRSRCPMCSPPRAASGRARPHPDPRLPLIG